MEENNGNVQGSSEEKDVSTTDNNHDETLNNNENDDKKSSEETIINISSNDVYDDFDDESEDYSDEDHEYIDKLNGDTEKTEKDIPHKGIFRTKEVANILKIPPSTLRSYCTSYEDIFNFERTPGGHRLFTQDDVDKLYFIHTNLITLNRFTVRQVIDYMQTPEGNALMPITNKEEQNKKLVSFLLEQIKPEIDKHIDLKVEQTIDERINDRLDNTLKEIKELLVNANQTTVNEVKRLLSSSSTEEKQLIEQKLGFIEEMKNENTELREQMSKVDSFINDWRSKQDELNNKQGFLSKLFKKK